MSELVHKQAVAVVGVGYLGERHARRAKEAGSLFLKTIFDVNSHKTRSLARELECDAAESLDQVLDSVDALIIATSTDSHRQVAEAALKAGKHVLVEKPLTGRVEDAQVLVNLAKEQQAVLQVGHVERFNPAIRSLIGTIPQPHFVESHRLAPLVPRSLDIDVVQDLMIHDIDLALMFIGETPESVSASGTAVLSGRVDIANARLSFKGGATANLTASRVSLERTRKFRMFLHGAYVSADCATGKTHVYKLKEKKESLVEEMVRSGKTLEMMRFLDHTVLGSSEKDALDEEHRAFALAIQGKPNRGVGGEAGLAALQTMVQVESVIRSNQGVL